MIHSNRMKVVVLLVWITFMTSGILLGQTKKTTVKKDPLQEKRSSTLLYQSGLMTKPDTMMLDWLLARVDEKQVVWDENYKKVKTVDDVTKYQKDRVDYFMKQLGPLWKKTPLNARVTGKIVKEGYYRAEKIVFESCPNFFATGTLFLPLEAKFKPPYPGVLVVCGHSTNGKAEDFYQRACTLGALNGLAMFIIDPIDQGDRFQHLEKGKPYAATVPAHNIVGGGSILLGRNTATFEIWDMMRALDYLQSRKDIIPDKLGAMGNSGGGTQSAYIMALDPRVLAAAPSCYICNMFDTLLHVNGPQDAEQNIFGQLGYGMDHADYCIMRAPRPTLLCTASNDMFNIEDAWKSFRFAKRMYGRFGFGERMSLVETDTSHGYYPQLREGGVRWMLRWLAGRDEAVCDDPKTPVLSEEEIQCVPKPGVTALPNAKTTYDLNRDLAKELTPKRNAIWQNITPEKAAELVRTTAGIRKLSELPAIKVCEKGKSNEQYILESDPGIYLPVRSNIKENKNENANTQSNSKGLTLFITDKGRNSEKANALFSQKGNSIVAVELRGWGETQATGRTYYLYKWFGTDGSDYYLAYLLGKSYIGMRTEDLLAVAKYYKEKYKMPIYLEAEGYAGTVALHGAIAEPQLFDSVKIEEAALPNWNNLVEKSPTYIQLTDTIHGVLNYYDTNNLLNYVKSIQKSK